MAKSNTPSVSIFDLRSQIAQGIRRIAVNPSIYGYRPLEYQEKFHKSKVKGKLFLGGNRAGKTVAGGAETVMRLTGNHPYRDNLPKPPVHGRSVSVDIEEGIKKISLPMVARWLPPSELINGSWEDSYSKGERKLTLNNGSTLEFMTYEQDVEKFAGTSRNFIWFDEEPPEDIFNECLLRLVDVGGDWWITMTPLIDMSWTYDRIYQKGLAGGKIQLPDGTEITAIEVFQASSLDNPFISAAEMALATEGISEEETDARQHGRYFSYTGAIYAPSLLKNSLTGVSTFIPPIVDTDNWPLLRNKWGHFGMIDYGFTNPTGFLLGAFDQQGRVIIYKEYYKSKALIQEHAVNILSIIHELQLEEKLEYIIGDPALAQTNGFTGTSIQAEFATNGVYIGLGNNDVLAGIERVSSRLKKGMLLITDDCEMLKWEMQRYRWAKWDTAKAKAKNNPKEMPMKKDDHLMDALRYGIVSRPELDGERPLRAGNILNAPVGLATNEHWIDQELNQPNRENSVFFDEFLGTDW